MHSAIHGTRWPYMGRRVERQIDVADLRFPDNRYPWGCRLPAHFPPFHCARTHLILIALLTRKVIL
jgi:hypothetical protein